MGIPIDPQQIAAWADVLANMPFHVILIFGLVLLYLRIRQLEKMLQECQSHHLDQIQSIQASIQALQPKTTQNTQTAQYRPPDRQNSP